MSRDSFFLFLWKKMSIKLILVLFCIIGYSCHSNNPVYQSLIRAEGLMSTFPDSSLYILEQISVDDFQKAKDKAKYALLLSEALDKNIIDLTHDSIIKPAVNYYSHKGNKDDKARMYYYLGRIYENAQDLEGAIKAFIAATKWVNEDDPKLKGLIYSHIGNLYTKQLNYGDALKMYQVATKEYEKAGDKINKGYSLSSEGWSLYMLQDFDVALNKCKESLELAKQQNDTIQILVLGRYVACILSFGFDDIKAAKDFLNEIYLEYTNGVIPRTDYAMWGHFYLQEGNYAIAEQYLLDEKDLESNPYILMGYYNLKAEINKKQNNYENALNWTKLAMKLLDSTYAQEKKILIQDLERKYQTQLIQNSYNHLKITQRYQIILSFLAFLLIAVVAILITGKFLKERRQRGKKIEEYQDFIRNLRESYKKVKAKNQYLSDQHGQKINNFRKVLEGRLLAMKDLMEIAATSGENIDIFQKKFRKYIHIESSDNKRKLFSNLHELVNLHYNGIIDYLKNEYPKLNSEDLDLCCLIYLQIPVSGIQLIYSYTNMDSLYNRRYRIRQKMGIPTGINLEQYLEQLLDNRMQSEPEIDD